MFKSGLGLRKPPRSHPSSPPPPPNPVGRSKSKKTKIARRSTLRNGGKGFDNSRLELDTATAQKAPPATSSSPLTRSGSPLCGSRGRPSSPGGSGSSRAARLQPRALRRRYRECGGGRGPRAGGGAGETPGEDAEQEGGRAREAPTESERNGSRGYWMERSPKDGIRTTAAGGGRAGDSGKAARAGPGDRAARRRRAARGDPGASAAAGGSPCPWTSPAS